ncbi:MAG TPA: isochorismatase family cysteine hydrolase [Usitatibacter sp.]|jgi:nicotinamidase-related amidase|nr:isochorismatase family cysteine hydrolase [Usitatibacter sp.]
MNNGSKRALVLVDFINLFDFEHSEKLAARAVEAAKRAAKLKERVRAAKSPCIYANDNFGHWRSDFSALVKDCLGKGGPSAQIARLLLPDREDYSVLKPRHSAFYETPLEFLLQELEVDSLILTGLSADMCVCATAQDAYVRKYKLRIPADCVAADTPEHEAQALDLMQRTLKADIRPSTDGEP